jgi:hypothetical protein
MTVGRKCKHSILFNFIRTKFGSAFLMRIRIEKSRELRRIRTDTDPDHILSPSFLCSSPPFFAGYSTLPHPSVHCPASVCLLFLPFHPSVCFSEFVYLLSLHFHPLSIVRHQSACLSILAMSNQRSFKIESFRFAAFVPKKIEYIRF